MTSPTIMITGANRGIGLELTEQFAADGWAVLACCRNPVEAEALQALVDSIPNNAFPRKSAHCKTFWARS